MAYNRRGYARVQAQRAAANERRAVALALTGVYEVLDAPRQNALLQFALDELRAQVRRNVETAELIIGTPLDDLRRDVGL